jgi:hypothetical protein
MWSVVPHRRGNSAEGHERRQHHPISPIDRSGHRTCGQALISWRPVSGAVTWILRGLDFSEIGIDSVSTPAS